jgi:drug/metabolite transporter (DMT)-like permease
MTWLWATLLAIFFFVFSTYVDKYLLTRYLKGREPGVLILFSTLFAVVVVPVIYAIEPRSLDVAAMDAFWLVFAGLLNITAVVLYLYAMQEDEVSVVAPLFQLAPIWTYLIGHFFLHEELTGGQVAGFFVLFAGAVFVSLDVKAKSLRFKRKPFVLMAIATLLLSVNTAVFKVIALEEEFWPSMFWQYAALIVAGVILFGGVRKYREEFLAVFRRNKVPVVALNVTNEITGVLGFLLISYAYLHEKVAIVSVVSSTQPLFLFLFGALFTLFFPSVAKEDLSRKVVLQKLGAASVIVAGAWLLHRSA